MPPTAQLPIFPNSGVREVQLPDCPTSQTPDSGKSNSPTPQVPNYEIPSPDFGKYDVSDTAASRSPAFGKFRLPQLHSFLTSRLPRRRNSGRSGLPNFSTPGRANIGSLGSSNSRDFPTPQFREIRRVGSPDSPNLPTCGNGALGSSIPPASQIPNSPNSGI